MKQSKPKFKVGQIVVVDNRKQIPFRIRDLIWREGWFYKWNRNNFAAESMVRELTPVEKGEEMPK